MSDRAGWEHKYCLSWQKAAITTDASATTGVYTSGDTGIFTAPAGGKCGIILDNKPTIDPGVEHINTPKANGISQEYNLAGRDYVVGKKMPTVQLVMGMNKFNSAVFSFLLFQQGITEAVGSPFLVTGIPPVAGKSDEIYWANFGMATGAGTSGDGYSMTGAICNSLAIAGEEGGRMVLTADLMGHTFVTTYDHTATDFTVTDVADELFFNYAFTFAGTSASVKAFDVTIINNSTANFYTNQIPQSYSMGIYNVTGNIRMSMADATIGDNVQIENFINGTDVLIVGTYTANNIISINAKYNGPPDLDPAEETILALPFNGVFDGTNNAAKIEASSGVDRVLTA